MLFNNVLCFVIRFGHQLATLAGFGMCIGYPGTDHFRNPFLNRSIESAAGYPVGIYHFLYSKMCSVFQVISYYFLAEFAEVLCKVYHLIVPILYAANI